MSVTTELAKTNQRLEYFVTIEGIGWPVNGLGGNLSGGFDGDIFTTNDIDGDLESTLQGNDLTVHVGLRLPQSIGEGMDPRNAAYQTSGMQFSINDVDDFLLGAITPRKSGTTTTLNSAMSYFETPVLADGTGFADGDVIWVGGREAIKLNGKALVGGTVYSYATSLRGFAGTQRGAALRRPKDYCLGYWPSGTTVYSVPWWWFNRQVALWAHVPGESVSNCSLMWYGKLRPIQNPGAGIEYRFSCTGDFIPTTARVRRAIDWSVRSAHFSTDGVQGASDQWWQENWIYAAARGMKRLMEFTAPAQPQHGNDSDGAYELAAAYIYRSEPGGLAGLVSSWDAGSVQARDIDGTTDCLHSYVYADESVWFMHARRLNVKDNSPRFVIADIISHAGKSRVSGATIGSQGQLFGGGFGLEFGIAADTPARFLLDNLRRYNKYKDRFRIWGGATGNSRHARHPVDVALMFMLSSDREFDLFDTTAGSTATVINKASSTTTANDALAGKALFCLEGNGGAGTAPELEACKITGSTATTVTVEGGFSAAPNAAVEMQVRNSVYDVLPLGWGMGIDSNLVDIDSFEKIRDEQIPQMVLGDFILGVQDEIDVWELVYENIFKPYGIFVYMDYPNRKISARYIGVTPGDGTFNTFTAITRDEIHDQGNITHVFTNPIGSISLEVRETAQRIVGTRTATSQELLDERMAYGANSVSAVVRNQMAALQDGETTSITLRSSEINLAFSEHTLDTIKISAMLNTDKNFEQLAGRLLGMLGEYSVPPPIWETSLDISLYESLQLGSFVSITWNTHSAPANPFTGNRGWVDVIGRVISRNYNLDGGPTFRCTIELLTTNLLARVAPAVVVTGKASDGLGAYFTCDETAAGQLFVSDPDNSKDWYKFAVGDTIEHRVNSGAVAGSWTDRAIAGFGTTKVSDPTAAIGSPMRIYLDGAIGSAYTANDYITLVDWPTSASTRRQYYSSYADASGELGPDNDPARVYG